jgi:CRISPR-associated protein Csb2
MRKALMAKTQTVEGGQTALALFSGRSADGNRLRDDHAHAFFLPADDNNDGQLDHLTVWIPAGIDTPTQKVLGRLRRLWGAGEQDIFTALMGIGNPADYGGLFVSRGLTPQLATSRLWVARTPFLLLRHPKVFRTGKPKVGESGLQIDGPEDQLRKELVKRGFPEPRRVDIISCILVKGKKLYWQDFRTHRADGGGQPAVSGGYGFRLSFDQPVQGPICLGYGCHFGLGQFIADGVIS